MLAVVIFNSCMQFRNPLPALWFYTNSEDAAAVRDTSLTPASFLELRSDGTYTRDFGKYEYGVWEKKGQQILLTSDGPGHHTEKLNFTLTGLNEMRLSSANGRTSDFESLSIPAKAAANDPFSRENNRWRLPATHKESDAEIRRRLFEHCRFWETYFKWALDKELTTVDVRSTPTAIKIYGNGFGLKPYEELPAAWKSYFYDSTDCSRANDMIGNIFRTRSIAWAHTDNKYKMFLGAFQQMETLLK